MFTRRRAKHIRGSVRRLSRRRGPDVWEYRYPDRTREGNPLRSMTFSTADYPTKGSLWSHIDSLLWKINGETPQNLSQELSFGGLCDRYITGEHLREISDLKRGQQNTVGTLKVSTARGYLQIIEKHIRPQWGSTPASRVTAAAVVDWMRQLPCSPVTKGHIKALMHRLFERAMLWEIVPMQRNPMSLVEVRGASRRSKRPLVLTAEQCLQILNALRQPYRTMVLVAICTGLRTSEILSLKWEDFDFVGQKMRVVRAVVRGIVDRTKTETSESDLPLDAAFASQLLEWKTLCPPSAEGWLFPSPRTGRPYEANLQQKVLRPTGDKLGIQNLGFHSFRHTYRSWLDASGTPIGIQQRLMRHAQVSTTLNVYGDAMMESKRQANSSAVRMLLSAELSNLGTEGAQPELQNAS